MLRKLFITSLDVTAGKTIASAGEALGYSLGDYGVIKPGDEGYEWQDREPRGYYLVIYDDLTQTPRETLEAVRKQLRKMGHRAIARSLRPGVNWVYMPDGLESDWYDMVWPLCEEIRRAEETYDRLIGQTLPPAIDKIAALRNRLQPVLDAGIEQAEKEVTGWALDLAHLLGGLPLASEGDERTRNI